MSDTTPGRYRGSERIQLPFSQSARMVGGYIWSRIANQLRSGLPIVLYLLAVQVLVLGTPVQQWPQVAIGVGLVIIGLAAFLEGLMLAVMPVGELCGLSLPRRLSMAGILLVVLLLGLLATAAEPSVVVLRGIGRSVTPWDAPLLFTLLGHRSLLLVGAIGIGVGLAFAMGVLRLLLRWSVKPMLLISVAMVLAVSIWARFEPNLALLSGLAWDTGAITTSDVTVPLMLALGVGISRMSGKKEDEASGFGAVAMASLVPVVTVLMLGAVLLPTVPQPMSREQFLASDHETTVRQLFGDRRAFEQWASDNLSPAELALWNGAGDSQFEAPGAATADTGNEAEAFLSVLKQSAQIAVWAVVPLALFLLFVVRVLLRRRLPWPDESLLGVTLCIVGMMLFTTGVEIGLKRLGDQSGKNLPVLFQPMERPEDAVTLHDFDPALVLESVERDGTRSSYFLFQGEHGPEPVPFVAERFDAASGTYLHIPRSEPRLSGAAGGIVLLLIALGLGFTVTLVEPAVAALGVTMESVTVGVFPRWRLMWVASAGVGVGTLAGFAMIVWHIPLLWILVPLYFVILVLTWISSELFAGISWDAGGATTASITVPVVLAMGSGLGGTLGTAESFGILALASAFPILAVLLAGFTVSQGQASGSGGSDESR